MFGCLAKDLEVIVEESLDLKEGYKVNITEDSVIIIVSTYSGYIYAL